MSKILVTGHSGLIGSHLVRLLAAQGHDVLGVSRTNRMKFENSFETDLTNENSAEFIFQKFKPDVVYHLAACAAEAKGQVSPIDMTKRNMLMTINVIRSAVNAGAKKIVYASSVSVYGSAPTPYSEYSQPVPKDIYGINKLSGEFVLKLMAQVYGFDYTILRPHNVYGPGQNPNDLTKNVINVFMRKILEEKPYTILGEGNVVRGFSYVEDVARVFESSLYALNGITMNVGTTRINTIKELSDQLQGITNSSVTPEYKPLRKQEIDVFVADHKLQVSLCEYKETPLASGLQRTWDWMKTQTLTDPLIIKEEIHV